jgi:hypothetical protein
MEIKEFFGSLESKLVSPKQLVEGTIGRPKVVMTLVEGLFANDLRVAYECAGLLRLISAISPCMLYPYYNSLADLLSTTDPVLRIEAEIILDQLCRVDCLEKGAYLHTEAFSTLALAS